MPAGPLIATACPSVAGRPQPAWCSPTHRDRRLRLPYAGLPLVGITDSQVHALVADGHHGRTDQIQDFVCQACGHRVSARRDTALFHLKTPPARIGEVLSALAEGLSVGAAVRVFGHGEATITRWRDRAAQQAVRLHHHFLCDLLLSHVQRDEIRTRLRPRDRILWLWFSVVAPSRPRTPLSTACGPP